MTTVIFKCDLCGKEEKNELHAGYKMPTFFNFSVCHPCYFDAIHEAQERKKNKLTTGPNLWPNPMLPTFTENCTTGCCQCKVAPFAGDCFCSCHPKATSIS